MRIEYIDKKPEPAILNGDYSESLLNDITINNSSNLLFSGDNLKVMRTMNRSELAGKIDLVYIDPPFATNTVFRSNDMRASHVSNGLSDEIAYNDRLLGAEYLEFIRERLILIRELMSNEASIYLHIDYKIGHYVKILMDEVFGPRNFRNDIARIKCNPKNFSRRAYGNIKDLVLFYSKTDKYTWNEPIQPRDKGSVERLFKKVDSKGRRYATTPLHAPGETANGNTGKEWKGMLPPSGRHWRYDPSVLDELDAKGLIEWSPRGNPRKIVYADEMPHTKVQDIWEFKDPQRPLYPTEKNQDLLKRIVKASSHENSIVFDCFAGSGSTLLAASELNRRWIGIDNSPTSIKVIKNRMAKHGYLYRYLELANEQV